MSRADIIIRDTIVQLQKAVEDLPDKKYITVMCHVAEYAQKATEIAKLGGRPKE